MKKNEDLVLRKECHVKCPCFIGKASTNGPCSMAAPKYPLGHALRVIARLVLDAI